MDNTALLNALINSKSEAAQAKSRGVDFQPVSVLPARKWIIRDQDKVNDVAAFSSFNISFDQLHKVSMNKQLLDEEHLKSLGYVVTYISVGQDPFVSTFLKIYRFVSYHVSPLILDSVQFASSFATSEYQRIGTYHGING